MLARIAIGVGLVFGLGLPCGAGGQLRAANAAITLRVRVAPQLGLQIGGVVAGSGETFVSSIAPDVVEVRLAAEGEPQTVELPLGISGNMSRFLLRAEGTGEGMVAIVSADDRWVARSLLLPQGGALAIGELSPGGTVRARLSLLRSPGRELRVRLHLQPLISAGL